MSATSVPQESAERCEPLRPDLVVQCSYPFYGWNVSLVPERNSESPGQQLRRSKPLEVDARNPLSQRGGPSALASAFKRVVDADPKFTRAWAELATGLHDVAKE